ncbi:YIP1 domain-containing protein [Cryptosporidium andersoni]|uniref:Protein YIPF n=1 Tax=Cryptosporidium andersoni TaxID=117008 RepID=A0A1J4MV84_9CRYT|nr:YIP1 domain-containing protein [Cryptosporidium andersoni]
MNISDKHPDDILFISGEICEENISDGTLDESVLTTIIRDTNHVYNKMIFYLLTYKRSDKGNSNNMQMLYNWDLWGPCLFLLVLSCCVYIKAPYTSKSNIFSTVYFVSFHGSIVVTLNSILLGSKCSFFAILSLLGYCLLPFSIISVISLVIPFTLTTIILTIIALLHTYNTISNLMRNIIPEDRQFLVLYPISLLYITIGYLVIVS